MTTTQTRPTRPGKPYPDFPLNADACGQWAKRINTKKYYFGSWRTDPTGELALAELRVREPGIRAGLDHLGVDSPGGDITVVEMCRQVMEYKHTELLAGKIADETFKDYKYELQLFADLLGSDAKAEALEPRHFAKVVDHMRNAPSSQDPTARKLNVHRLGTAISYIRAAFNLAADNGWIVAAPPFGTAFRPPGTSPEDLAVLAQREGRDEPEDPLYTPAQIAWLLDNASKQFRAMILLMLNCGMGASDVGRLKWKHIDFKTGRLSLRRSKTGIQRECYLWKRTREALTDVRELKHTREALERDADSALVFITRKGLPYIRRDRVMEDGKVKKIKLANSISITIGRMIKRAKEEGVIPRDKKLTAYNLRHTYRSWADNCPDLNAVLRTMGRKLYGQADSRYVRGPFELKRLKTVALTVKRYAFPKVNATPPADQGQE